MPSLFCTFCWLYFRGNDAANECLFSPNYGIWEQAWLSLFYHRFILVWFAFEVRPQRMLWLILGLLWYFYSKFIELMHLAYGVTQTIIYILSFMLFLVNWGAWHMQWWPTFLSLQSNLISCTWLLTGKKLLSGLYVFLQLCYTMLLS